MKQKPITITLTNKQRDQLQPLFDEVSRIANEQYEAKDHGEVLELGMIIGQAKEEGFARFQIFSYACAKEMCDVIRRHGYATRDPNHYQEE